MDNFWFETIFMIEDEENWERFFRFSISTIKSLENEVLELGNNLHSSTYL